MSWTSALIEELRQKGLTDDLGQVTCYGDGHNLWTAHDAKCEFCKAIV